MEIVSYNKPDLRFLAIRAFGLVPVLALAAVISALPARARDADLSSFAYDPTKCTEDARGKRYIALGATVLAILPDPLFLAGASAVDPKDLLIPPNPNDKPGCPGNPNQILIRFPIKAISPNLAEVSKKDNVAGRSFGLAPMHGLGVGALDPKPAIPQVDRDQSGISDWTCNHPGAAVIHEEGAEICRWPAHAAEPATAFNAYPPRYSTPAGDPFRIWCGSGAYGFGLTPCYVGSYGTPSGLAIAYEFLPTVSIRTANYLDRLIDYDRQLRAAVYAAVIADYPWPQRLIANPKRK